jgi:hypothetical protein
MGKGVQTYDNSRDPLFPRGIFLSESDHKNSPPFEKGRPGGISGKAFSKGQTVARF